jgi:hypothetical protein
MEKYCYLNFKVSYLAYMQRSLTSSPGEFSSKHGTIYGFGRVHIFKFSPAENSTTMGSVVAPDKSANNFAPSNIDGAGTQDNTATTTFVTDANLVNASISMEKNITSLITNSSTNYIEEDIKSFLAKPRIAQSGVLSTTDTVSTFSKIVVPVDIFSQLIYANKLAGFYSIRMTTVLTLQINANKFQQGLYMLCIVPICGDDSNGANATNWNNAHISTLTQRTQLPHVELNIACDTQAQIRFPFVSAHNAYPIRATGSNFFNLFTAQLFPYVPLTAPTGSTTCNYTLWVHFEDIRLYGPANPESTSFERKSKNIDPPSSILMRASKLVGQFDKVPVLSSYSAPTSTALDIMSRAAALFGWSKPNILSPPTRINRIPALYSGNVDGNSGALPTGYTIKQAVDILPGFAGTDIDEMDISYIASIPAFHSSFNWTTAQTAGTLIRSMPVGPYINVPFTTGIGGKVFNHLPPVSFCASYFTYWRGSMTYTFKLVKTEFHSGRLVIAFTPIINGTTPTSSLANTQYVHRDIIDIREHTSFTVTVPYISPTAYSGTVNNTTSTGVLELFVLDSLVAPSSVSSTVTIVMEISGGPDIEFASPQAPNWIPVYAAVPQSGRPDECKIIEKCIGTSIINYDKGSNAINIMGERVNSFRSLIKVASLMSPTSALTIGTSTFLNFNPFVGNVYYNFATNATPPWTQDLYTVLSSIYGLVRGGVVIRVYANTTTTGGVTFGYIYNDSTSQDSFVGLSTTDRNVTSIISNYNNVPLIPHNIFQEKINEYVIPQYQKTHSRPCVSSLSNPINLPLQTGINSTTPNLAFSVQFPNVPTSVFVSRAGSDDINFGMFISIPPMTSIIGTAYIA